LLWILFLVTAALLSVTYLVVVVNNARHRREIRRWSADEKMLRQWQLLFTLYQLSGGSSRYGVSPRKLGRKLGWNNEEILAVRDELESAQLLVRKEARWFEILEQVIDSMGSNDSKSRPPPKPGTFVAERLHITAFGAEQVRRNQDSPTPALDLSRVLVHVSGQGNQVMMNSPGGYQSAQMVFNRANVVRALQEFRDALRVGELDKESVALGEAHLTIVESELRKPNPDYRTLRLALNGMLQIALGAAGNGVWEGVAALLKQLLQ
jgi:hypothetical protein